MSSLVVIRDNKRSNFCFRRTFQALKSLISSGFLVYYHLKYSLKSCVPQRGQGTHSFYRYIPSILDMISLTLAVFPSKSASNMARSLNLANFLALFLPDFFSNSLKTDSMSSMSNNAGSPCSSSYCLHSRKKWKSIFDKAFYAS